MPTLPTPFTKRDWRRSVVHGLDPELGSRELRSRPPSRTPSEEAAPSSSVLRSTGPDESSGRVSLSHPTGPHPGVGRRPVVTRIVVCREGSSPTHCRTRGGGVRWTGTLTIVTIDVDGRSGPSRTRESPWVDENQRGLRMTSLLCST